MAACGQSDVVLCVKERDIFRPLPRQRFCQGQSRQLKRLFDGGVGSIQRNLQSAISTNPFRNSAKRVNTEHSAETLNVPYSRTRPTRFAVSSCGVFERLFTE